MTMCRNYETAAEIAEGLRELGDQPILYCYWSKRFAEHVLRRSFTAEQWANFCDEQQDFFVEGANEAAFENIAASTGEDDDAATP
jgi:hypothetical protein